MTNRILTINTGSSSLKFSLTGVDTGATVSGQVKDIGRNNGVLVVHHQGKEEKQSQSCTNHADALNAVLNWLNKQQYRFTAVAHRLVHGGPNHVAPEIITPELLGSLRHYIPWAPDHLPPALNAIEQLQEGYPGLVQVACFDTFFHAELPAVAYTYALPASLREKGFRKYGFHGLSCASILAALQREDPAVDKKKIIIAHLGNGASITAVQNGKSIDNTMGLTPNGGLVMSSRTGDLDPGVVLNIQLQEGLTVAATDDLIHHQSGLRGLSGISGNIQELLEQASLQPAAQQAIDIFCYQARKQIGALIAALNGLDILVFTGGAGEHAPLVRQKICEQLSYAGIRIDINRNQVNHPLISHEQDAVQVKVMAADEEAIMVQQAAPLLYPPSEH